MKTSFVKNIILFCWVVYLNGNPVIPDLINEGLFIPDTIPVNVRTTIKFKNTLNENFEFIEADRDRNFEKPSFESQSFSLETSLVFFERVEAYFEVGQESVNNNFFYLNDFFKTHYLTKPFYVIGGRCLLIEKGDFCFGVEGNYTFFNSSSNFFSENDRPLFLKPKLSLFGWKINVSVGYKIKMFAPYVGISYRDVNIHIKNMGFQREVLELYSKHKEGLFYGTSISAGKIVAINLEVRDINEKSYLVSFLLRF